MDEKISEAISQYIALRDAKNDVMRKAKSRAADFDVAMENIISFLTREADRAGLQGFRSSTGGEAHFTMKRFVKTVDWPEFLSWVKAENAWHCLEKRPGKNAVLEYSDENESKAPPGLSIERIRVMEVRR